MLMSEEGERAGSLQGRDPGMRAPWRGVRSGPAETVGVHPPTHHTHPSADAGVQIVVRLNWGTSVGAGT